MINRDINTVQLPVPTKKYDKNISVFTMSNEVKENWILYETQSLGVSTRHLCTSHTHSTTGIYSYSLLRSSSSTVLGSRQCTSIATSYNIYNKY